MRAVDMNHDFIGRDAVRRALEAGPARRRVGLQGEGTEPSVPPCGAQVLDADGREIGTVTSAAYSGTLERVIAMAYVSDEAAEVGTEVTLSHAFGRLAATVSPMPFAPPMLA
jgi:aminomethyltransferase